MNHKPITTHLQEQQEMIMFRQGDVLVRQISEEEMPKQEDLRKVEKDEGRVILAYGEVTGHAHAFAKEDRVSLFMEQVNKVFEGNASRFPGRQSSPVALQEREPERMPNVRRFLKVDSESTLLHEEHGTITVPKGLYEVVIQREYHPEAIRQVLD